MTTSTAFVPGFFTSYVSTVRGRPEASASRGWKGEKASNATVTGHPASLNSTLEVGKEPRKNASSKRGSPGTFAEPRPSCCKS